MEACKQSRRSHIPEIMPIATPDEAAMEAKKRGGRLIVAHIDESSVPIHTLQINGDSPIALFVGPEGGLTEKEAVALQALDATFVNLGSGILRVETAAIALLASLGVIIAGNRS